MSIELLIAVGVTVVIGIAYLSRLQHMKHLARQHAASNRALKTKLLEVGGGLDALDRAYISSQVALINKRADFLEDRMDSFKSSCEALTKAIDEKAGR